MTDTNRSAKAFDKLGLTENLATQTKWICEIPLSLLFPDLRGDMRLNLASFTIPEVALGVASQSYLSKRIEKPTGVLQPEAQQITFEYVLSSNFHQYVLLYRWVQRMVIEMQGDSNYLDHGDTTKYLIPVTITMLSEFKKPILKITYENSWLYSLGEIRFDYRIPQDDLILHAFTIKFTNFKMDILTDIGGTDGKATALT